MSAQSSNVKKIASISQAISANVTSLLSEVALVPTQPPTNNNDEILHQLQKIRSELSRLRSDMNATMPQSADQDEPQEDVIDQTNLEELLELNQTKSFSYVVATAGEHNELARSYNSRLQHHCDFIAPLHNNNNKPVFGFPATLGVLVSLDSTAEQLLCGALKLDYKEKEYVFAKFCGFNPRLLDSISRIMPTGSEIALIRILNHNQRALDLERAGDPTTNTRRASKHHNSIARKYNATASSINPSILPLHDARNLEIPGSPTKLERLSRARRRDVLWMLGEYGQDVEEVGCWQRFEKWIGVAANPETEKGPEWLL